MSKNSTASQKGITSLRLRDIIDICKEKGVSRIKITGKDVELELFPFAVNIGSLSSSDGYDEERVDSDLNLGHNDDKTDMDLLLHSAGK